MQVLVVEDDRSLSQELRRGLLERGYDVEVAPTLAQGEWHAADRARDAIVLDVRLPDGDGFELCRRLRRAGNTTPIILLSGLTLTADKVRGLDAGADDFITKPVALDELCARLRAVARRHPAGVRTLIRFDNLELDLQKHRATRAGDPIRLTPKEFALLEHFVRNPERALTRKSIGQDVWDLEFDPDSNLIEVFVSALRRKLGSPRLIHTVSGVGYMMSKDPSAP